MKTCVLMGATLVLASTFAANADTDACGLLRPGQVTAAVGFPVGDGKHVTPTFVQTCTWTGSNSAGAQFVTLNLQTSAFFDGAKRQAVIVAAAGGALKPAGIGEDSYYAVTGTQVALWVKKGTGAFKVAVYKPISVEQKEQMELALARQVVGKL